MVGEEVGEQHVQLERAQPAVERLWRDGETRRVERGESAETGSFFVMLNMYIYGGSSLLLHEEVNLLTLSISCMKQTTLRRTARAVKAGAWRSASRCRKRTAFVSGGWIRMSASTCGSIGYMQ